MIPIIPMRTALADPDLLARALPGDTFRPHRILLTAAFGEALDDDERKVFWQFTGRSHEPGQRVNEFCVVAGRRTAKTSGLMSTAATYLAALCDHRDSLRPAETGVLLCLAQDQRVARQILNYVEEYITKSPILRPRFIRRTEELIELTNNITVEVRPASARSLRGPTYIGIFADELAHWRVDEFYENPDIQVIGAARPGGMTTHAPLFMASSPRARRGMLWDTYNRHFGPKGDPDILVACGTTRAFNPTISQAAVDRELERDPETNRAEYLGEFRSDLEAYVRLEAVEACISKGVHERPWTYGVTYYAFMDPATGSGQDSWTLCIGHVRDGNVIVIDLLREWRPPFKAHEVVEEICSLCRTYYVYKIVSDKTGKWVESQFAHQHGVAIETSAKVKHDLYVNLLPYVNSTRAGTRRRPRYAGVTGARGCRAGAKALEITTARDRGSTRSSG